MRYGTNNAATWGVRQITASTVDAVLLGDARQWLKLENSDEDGLIMPLIGAARRLVEAQSKQVLLASGWRLTLDCFPFATRSPDDLEEGLIRLPFGPVSAVTAIGYRDSAGVAQVMAPADYLVDLSRTPSRIAPAYGKAWPATRAQIAAVTVDFTAGYASAAAVPEDLKLAMKLLVAHWFENREAVVVGTINGALQIAFDALIDGAKNWSLR